MNKFFPNAKRFSKKGIVIVILKYFTAVFLFVESMKLILITNCIKFTRPYFFHVTQRISSEIRNVTVILSFC